jgi:hypothetical protein
MLRRSPHWLAAKTLHAMLNRFKVAGAHPDILAAVDPEKASHNGQALIKLEQLLQKRTVPTTGDERRSRDEEHRLIFWLRGSATKASRPSIQTPKRHVLGTEAELPSQASLGLRSITCHLTPFAQDRVVKDQLRELFAGVGIDDEFDLPKGPGGSDVQSVLEDVRIKHEEHVKATEPLTVRGNQSVRWLRSIGVILTLEDRGQTYLLTLPERFDDPERATDMPDQRLSQDIRAYLATRNMLAFDFRMGGSYHSVEHVVTSIERLQKLYAQHRGTCLRPGVCICLTLTGNACYCSDDGTIVLPAIAPHTWEEYLLTLPQAKWNELVKLNQEWRAENPTKLKDHKAKIHRVCDILHYHSLFLDTSTATGRQWQDDFLNAFLKEEGAIRKTMERYKSQLKIADLKNRGKLRVCPRLWKEGFTESAGKHDVEVPCRLTSDGRIHVSAAMAKPVPLLKILRDNNQAQAKKLVAFDSAMASLEGFSRLACVEVTIDPEWRDKCKDVAKCVEHFVATAKPIAKVIAARLQSQRKGLLLIVSDRYHVTPSGKALVPWDVDVGTLQTAMIAAK